MFTLRFLVFCLLSSAGITAIHADDAVGPQTAEKPKPAATEKSGITFDWVHVDGPFIAMTFDDGPSTKLTPKLLDLLAAHHIKATFFLIGQNVAENPEIVAREVREVRDEPPAPRRVASAGEARGPGGSRSYRVSP